MKARHRAGLVLLAAIFAFGTGAGTAAAEQDEGPILRPRKPPAKPAGATLLVMCDLACNWKLDGKAKGHLDAGGSTKAKIELGQHVVLATTEDGADQVKLMSEAKTNSQTVVSVELKPVRDARLKAEQQEKEQKARERAAREEAAGVWTDPATGLMWAKKDNGADVTWQQATDYCRNLQLAGYSDWRLPMIDELQGIYDPNANVPGEWGSVPGQWSSGGPATWHVKGNLQLSGWHWSNSPGNASGEAWWFDFGGGYRSLFRLGYSSHLRALCGRRSGE